MNRTRARFAAIALSVVAIVALLGMVACSGGQGGAGNAQKAEAEVAVAAPEGSAVNEKLGVSIDKCEFIAASGENPTIAITYSFTNPHDFNIPFDIAVFPTLTQGSSPLGSSYLFDGTEGSAAVPGTQEVAPGETVEVQKTYVLSSDEDVQVTCSAFDPETSEKVDDAASRTFVVKESYAALKAQA